MNWGHSIKIGDAVRPIIGIDKRIGIVLEISDNNDGWFPRVLVLYSDGTIDTEYLQDLEVVNESR